MTDKHARTATIVLFGLIPFLLSSIFLFRNTFPNIDPISGTPIHVVRDVIVASSIFPAFGAMFAAFTIQALFIKRRFSHSTSANKIIHILSSLAMLLVLWVSIVVTEIWVHSIYFGLWDMYVLEFNPMSASSYIIGIAMSLYILFTTFQNSVFSKPPNHSLEQTRDSSGFA